MTSREKRYAIRELCHITGFQEEFVHRCVKEEWIRPATPDGPEFDDEDLSRMRLIRQLFDDFGVNDASVPIILHLLDQVHYLRRRILSATKHPR